MKFYTSVLPYRGRLLVRGVDKDGTQKNIELIINHLFLFQLQKSRSIKH